MTRCHIKASDPYSKVRVREVSAVSISAPVPRPEVWLLVLEISSDMVQPSYLADLFKKEVLLPFALELLFSSGSCLVLA